MAVNLGRLATVLFGGHFSSVNLTLQTLVEASSYFHLLCLILVFERVLKYSPGGTGFNVHMFYLSSLSPGIVSTYHAVQLLISFLRRSTVVCFPLYSLGSICIPLILLLSSKGSFHFLALSSPPAVLASGHDPDEESKSREE